MAPVLEPDASDMAPDQSELTVQVPLEASKLPVPEPAGPVHQPAGQVPEPTVPAPDPWLQKFPLQPAAATVEVREITVFKVSDILRERTPECFKIKRLQLGLQNRTLDPSVLQDLKLEIAAVIHDKLSTQTAAISDIQSWEAFAAAVVGDVSRARGHFETCTPGMSDAAVRHHLALDALFLVFFFQFKGGFFIISELKEIGSSRKATISRVSSTDHMLLENQIPMYLLKNVVRELCKMDENFKGKQTNYEMSSESKENSFFMEVVENELDNILISAIRYLHREISGAHDSNSKQEVTSYIVSHYPCHTSSALENCHHILDCVYHFLCGHTLPLQPKRPSYVHLDDIPSVSRLEDHGVKVDGSTGRAAWLVGGVKLHGSWLRSASLRLPKFRINFKSLTQFRNLAVYELLLRRDDTLNLYYGDMRLFLGLMAQLCRDTPDWYLLRKRGVLNLVYGDIEVVELWDKCLSGLARPNPSPEWIALYTDIHNHCRSSLKKWRRRNWGIFCNQPWVFISVSAAFVLLVMTGLQTWFTVVNSSSSKAFWPPSR